MKLMLKCHRWYHAVKPRRLYRVSQRNTRTYKTYSVPLQLKCVNYKLKNRHVHILIILITRDYVSTSCTNEQKWARSYTV